MFQFIDADEGRSVNDKHANSYSRPKYGATGRYPFGQREEIAPAV